MDAEFCIEGLEDVLTRSGNPEIFNSDQGSQSAAPHFIEILEEHQIWISMGDGWTTCSLSVRSGC
jgi:putative transposase